MVESDLAAQPRAGIGTLTARQTAIVAVAVLAMFAVYAALAYTFYGGPERHGDREGPLGSLGGYGIGFDPSRGSTWTVGVALCLAHGSQPAVLDGSVTPTGTVGSGMRYLGAFMRQGGEVLVGGSRQGFPPPGPGTLHAVKGYTVTRQCELGDPDPTQLLIGIGWEPGTNGGGWRGFDIGYTWGWRHHIVSLEGYFIGVCGPDAPTDACPQPSQNPTATAGLRL